MVRGRKGCITPHAAVALQLLRLDVPRLDVDWCVRRCYLEKKGCERHLCTILFHDDLKGLGLVLVVDLFDLRAYFWKLPHRRVKVGASCARDDLCHLGQRGQNNPGSQ